MQVECLLCVFTFATLLLITVLCPVKMIWDCIKNGFMVDDLLLTLALNGEWQVVTVAHSSNCWI